MSETTPEDRLADWLMTNLPRVHRWMTVGWRETMRDEAVALSREMLDAALIRDDRPPVGSTGAAIDDEAKG